MAPNLSIDWCYGREAQIETFLMSNITPQTPTLNRGVWARLERLVRDALEDLEEVWVFTGPIFCDENELPSGAAAPCSFYKIVVGEFDGNPRVAAFIIPQDGGDLDSFLTSIDQIEMLSGFDFLWMLDLDEEAISEYLW